MKRINVSMIFIILTACRIKKVDTKAESERLMEIKKSCHFRQDF